MWGPLKAAMGIEANTAIALNLRVYILKVFQIPLFRTLWNCQT
jgi:hypothetical protein